MARPRFLFLSGQAGAVASGQPWYSWRLVGGNNRPLAASWGAYPTLPECHQAVSLLQQLPPEGRTGLVADVTTGLWSWRLEQGERRLAVSARSYQRQRECRYNLDAFLAAVPLAVASTDLLVLPPGRTHGRPGPADDLAGLRRALAPR